MTRHPSGRRRAGLRAAAAAVLGTALACGGGGGGRGPSGPSAPGVPVPVSPASGAIVDTPTPTLVVRNASGYDAGQATYDFVVLDAAGQATVQEVTGVPAGAGETRATLPQPLVRGGGYQWKAIARAGQSVESSPVPFEVGLACEAGGSPYAKAVVDSFVSPACRRVNKADLLDPENVLGPPDALGRTNNSYRGFMSLGDGGYVVVDMGICAQDREGDDVRVFQYIESEPVTVRVSGSPDGPWILLGTKPCGSGGTPDRSNHCDFDLAAAGLRAARYVWVEDAENFPCEQAGTRTEGADIDAVEVLNVRR